MKEKFFQRLDWAAFWAATLVTFAVYFLTLGPSVGLEDSGELATAAANLGVPHPPGYPFWTFCSWLFCKAFGWVTYMGHPTPAWCVSLCSAVFGAFAAGFTAMLICRSSRDFIGKADGVSGVSEPLPVEGVNRLLCFGGGVAGALTFSLSPVEWSQSTIVEIYSLNAFFLMWVFLLSYRWMRKPSDKILWLTAFVFGLGLTNYQVLLFAIVPLALIMLMRNIAMFRDVFIYLIPVALTYQVLQIGQLMRADQAMQSDVINKYKPILGKAVTTPSSTLIVISLVALVGAIAAAAVLRRRDEAEKARQTLLYVGGGAVALMALAALVFTSTVTWSPGSVESAVAPLYAPTRYALIAALLAGSVVSAVLAAFQDEDRSTDPKTLRLLVISSALAVVAILFALMIPSADNGGYLGKAYPWAKSTAMFWGLVVLLFVLCGFTKKGLCFAIPVAGLQIAAFVLLRHGVMNGLTHPMSWWFGWPVAWNFVLLAMTWAILPNGRSVAGAAFFAQLGVSFYAYMPIVSDLRNPPMNWGYPRTWDGFKHAIMRGQYEAIGVPSFPSVKAFFDFVGIQMWHYLQDLKVQFTDLLLLFAPVPFVVGHIVVSKDHRKTFWQWMGAAAACFLMMSFLLILLANVKGDVQDGFIQKVKFISSHAMVALWIGYGLVFAAKMLVGVVKVPALVLAAAMILVAGVYPIVQNYCDDRMVFELGGNEQNGHTFGWQFGAYQLEGAKAIRAQLVADEEPLPDPDWPEAMEPFSIFFGGTDPGRFVPTYMIYSAKYRPDVYLITQNALADDTYMSVERDLYGDEIWIPAKEDSAEAFNIYVDEVQRGVRPANGDLKIENGRVQVTGALGVMEINGILTKMMFDHDRLRHAFYVEESYVIPWMYDYLSPHGLIMRLNADKTPYDEKTARKDADFWDWYVRRLVADPMYRRDFAGQKSFSKLRAAIGGLYTHQRRYGESAQAFREACVLYPASPEASFRYAQECLLPFRKHDIALDLMDYTDCVDPKNQRTKSIRSYVAHLRAAVATMDRLRPKLLDKTITTSETLELAACFSDMGRVTEAARLCGPLVDSLGDPKDVKWVAQILAEAGMGADAEKAYAKYLRSPGVRDALAWAELARLQHRAGRTTEAQQSFVRGYQIDRQALFDLLVKKRDQEIIEIATPLFQRAR